MQIMFCTACGGQTPSHAQFCPQCGVGRASAGSPDARPGSVPRPDRSVQLRVVPSDSDQHEASRYQHHLEELRQRAAQYQRSIASFEHKLSTLKGELESVEDAVEIQSFGFYRPRYGLETSKEYTDRLKSVREEQRNLIRKEAATHCPKNWIVDGSVAKGKQMLQEQSKLMLRAFNGECDAAIGKVKYDNVANLQKRLNKSFEAINKLGAAKKISITEEYLALKLGELHLVHEHREKVYEEKEEERRIKEQMREEQKAEKELAQAQREAEKKEASCEKALMKAQQKLAGSPDTRDEKLLALVAKLERELKEARDQKAKTDARVLSGTSGHVYVISNIGSFGEGVYAIGMTRRLEPMDRVRDLGDASVPFRFDVHAIVYSEDALGLEKALHGEFADRRMNMVNRRREFFRVSLDEIRLALARHHGTTSMVTVPEAEEYRKSLALVADREMLD